MNKLALTDLVSQPLLAWGSKVREEKFEEVANKITKLYPKHKVYIHKEWNKKTENAFNASFSKTIRPEYKGYIVLVLYGGLAKLSGMTKDAYAMITCHEVGHSLAGPPTKEHSPASSEGQSDYYATMNCFRKYARKVKSEKINYGKLSPKLSKECDKAYSGFFKKNDRKICKRSILAAYQMISVTNTLRKKIREKTGEKYKPVSMNNSDPALVDVTNRKYPKPQCRFDTLVRGALCPRPPNKWKIGQKRKNECKDPRFKRPRCWYKP